MTTEPGASRSLSVEELMRLEAELVARVRPSHPDADINAIARGFAYFGRTSEHDHRLALEREPRSQ